jgi:glycosyltransferase involved in cell wall biosynthesis
MVALHATATCLAYPSLYEGFGLPLVKSLKVGTPIITSDVSSMPEIVGKSAILVDPTSVDQIAKALEKILHSQKLRNQLSLEGIAQSIKFSWTKTATQTLQVYNQVTDLSKN